MNHYFFILGKNPTLSLAELLTVFAQEGKTFSIIATQPEFVIFEFPQTIDAVALMGHLGGTIKIGKIIDEIKKPELENIGNLCYATLAPHQSQRLNFGFSSYPSTSYQLKAKNYLKLLALSLKSRLKEQGIASRWVTSKEPTLSSVVVQKNHLLDQGAEFVLLPSNNAPLIHYSTNSLLLGCTLAVQPFEEYGLREFGKPSRPIEQGILPVKLARIMINLAAVPKKGAILDPFCGSGTILGEAVAMGYQNIIGSDISKEAVQQAQTNIQWLLSRPQAEKQNPSVKIIPCNVRKLSTTPIRANAIITEPYLGPTKLFNYSIRQLESLAHELSLLYLAAFTEFAKILHPNSRVVFIFPAFSQPPLARGGEEIKGRFSQKPYSRPSLSARNGSAMRSNEKDTQFLLEKGDALIKTSELVTVHLIPLGFTPVPLIHPNTYSALYSRPGQQVSREIMVFVYKPR